METYINDNMDLWNEKNISLKKSIINQFSEEKSKWIKIGKLNIPSKKLLTQEGHFISTGKMWELEHEIYKSKEEYDIFAIYSDKEDLYKIYNNPDLSNLDLDDRRFETDASGEYVPKNNPINFEEKILYPCRPCRPFHQAFHQAFHQQHQHLYHLAYQQSWLQ